MTAPNLQDGSAAETTMVMARPRKSPDVYDEPLADGGLVLFQSQRALILTLNPTGALIWECCDGMHDVDAITAELREVFPTAARARQDVQLLLASLCQHGMITDAGTVAG